MQKILPNPPLRKEGILKKERLLFLYKKLKESFALQGDLSNPSAGKQIEIRLGNKPFYLYNLFLPINQPLFIKTAKPPNIVGGTCGFYKKVKNFKLLDQYFQITLICYRFETIDEYFSRFFS